MVPFKMCSIDEKKSAKILELGIYFQYKSLSSYFSKSISLTTETNVLKIVSFK